MTSDKLGAVFPAAALGLEEDFFVAGSWVCLAVDGCFSFGGGAMEDLCLSRIAFTVCLEACYNIIEKEKEYFGDLNRLCF